MNNNNHRYMPHMQSMKYIYIICLLDYFFLEIKYNLTGSYYVNYHPI